MRFSCFDLSLPFLIFPLVHNCRIDINDVIKVSDFGLTEDIYAKNYYRQEEDGETPVKLWMALESLNDGIFSEKTDVVRTPIPFLRAHYNRLSAVVIWSDMLGGVLIGEEPQSWSGPLFSHQISGEWRETGQTSQCCLLTGYVSFFIIVSTLCSKLVFPYDTIAMT